MNCKICQCAIDNNVAVFTAVNSLIAAGKWDFSMYDDLAIQLCENAGCDTREE